MSQLNVHVGDFVNAQGFGGGDQFFTYLKDSFDVLCAEGATSPKMMSIGLHCGVVGRSRHAHHTDLAAHASDIG
jgi:hypothetical protein